MSVEERDTLLLENVAEIAFAVRYTEACEAIIENDPGIEDTIGVRAALRERVGAAALALTELELAHEELLEHADWYVCLDAIADDITAGNEPDVEAILKTQVVDGLFPKPAPKKHQGER